MHEPVLVAWQPTVVQRLLSDRWRAPILLEQTGSTNDDIARIAEESGLSDGEWLLVASRHQRAGRGRRGRFWQAQPGEALLFSVATRLHVPAERWPSASLIVCHALLETLRKLLPLDAPSDLLGLRWPNDLLAGRHNLKLGGVLCERIPATTTTTLHTAGSWPQRAPKGALWVAGCGLNLRAPTQETLAPHATGLAALMPDGVREGVPEGERPPLEVSALLGNLAIAIQHHIDAWQLRGGAIMPDVHSASLRFRGVEVGLDLGDGRRRAAWLDGVDATGALRIRDVSEGVPVGPERSVSPLRILDAMTEPPWHHPADPAPT